MISSKTPSSTGLFESISLSSSVPAKRIENERANTIPESASATSDDDNLDPTEFISPEDDVTLGQGDVTQVKEGGSKMENGISAPTIPEEEFFSNPSKMHSESSLFQDSTSLNHTFTGTNSDIMGFYHPVTINKASNEEPIKFLTKKTDILLEELQNNVRGQKQALLSGVSELNRYRSMISQNFFQLSEAQYSLNELYFQETAYLELVDSSFRKWDSRRNKILKKITSIKSDGNKYGRKLASIVNEDRVIDTEIASLEEKLKGLKNKKKLIRKEMETTSSILESKAFKFVESYKESEANGKEMVKMFLKRSNVPPNQINNILKHKPISIDFRSKSSSHDTISIEKAKQEEKVPRIISALDKGKKSQPNQETNATDIGMQPYIYEEPTNPANETTLDNNGALPGSNAFEKGYLEGSKGSRFVKDQVSEFLKSVFEQPDNKRINNINVSGRFDDLSNKIIKKIDIEPTLALLKYKISALKQANISSSNNAHRFHEYGSIWKEVLSVLKNQEEEIANQIALYGLEGADETLFKSLSTCLDHLAVIVERSSLLESASESKQTDSNFLNEAISNELNALISASKMVSKNVEIEKEQIQRFEKLGLYLKNDDKSIEQNKETRKSKARSSTHAYMYNDANKKSFPSVGTSNLQHLSSEDFISPNESEEKSRSMKSDLKNIFHEFASPKQMKRE